MLSNKDFFTRYNSSLFDLKNDPEELSNLAELPEYQEKKTELFNELLNLQKEMNDPLGLTAYYN